MPTPIELAIEQLRSIYDPIQVLTFNNYYYIPEVEYCIIIDVELPVVIPRKDYLMVFEVTPAATLKLYQWPNIEAPEIEEQSNEI